MSLLQYALDTNLGRPDMVLSASADESIRLWNVLTGLTVGVFSGDQGHSCEVLGVSWCSYYPDLFVSSGVDSSVRIWSMHQVCCITVSAFMVVTPSLFCVLKTVAPFWPAI
jgi:WD40 repeat protein